MGLGYTTMMYDSTEIAAGIGDVAACQYDGVEIGLEKVREAGPDRVDALVEEYDLDLYCVMSEWLETEAAVDRVAADLDMLSDLGVNHIGLLPPQRNRQDDATVEEWFTRLSDAATDAGVTPLVHHHGATHVEQNDEVRRLLDAVDGLELLWDTAHYYPYGENFPEGDVTDGIERFADDIGYVHLKDVAPPTGFGEMRDSLSAGDFHLDHVINYFRSFTDLGRGTIDFEAVSETLEDVGYDGDITIEIENRTEKPLVHAKENYDYWRDIRPKEDQ
ncbi:sugar phosphate isomerase/epimerase family protein [Haloarcula nitratireducens]|uniref:Sugar phosphate isomerase/epimerase n=1 Tax=Haloarcula nitratireducens TaxID=2487749 RepID=A0AAW4PEZ9_9EURY|nr:sugar phosphate isomerase/epimerase [Halomicroarcula nitratireducens]MBX0296178.1 sugar phosphate isomerase/epimerase [Halomicroarcula nitratireducens]